MMEEEFSHERQDESLSGDRDTEILDIGLEELEKEFDEAVRAARSIASTDQSIQNDPDATEEEKLTSSKLVGEAVAELVRLNQLKEEVIAIQHGLLNPKTLPWKVRLADWYADEGFTDLYNSFVTLAATRKNGQMTDEEIAFREKLAQNIYPFGYVSSGSIIGTTLGMALDSLENPEDSYNPEEGIPSFARNNGNPFSLLDDIERDLRPMRKEVMEHEDLYEKVRIDLFRHYLGLPQYFNFLEDSEYKPSKASTPDAKYYQFSPTSVLQAMAGTLKDDGISEFNDLLDFAKKESKLPYNSFMGNLGRHIVDVGYDEERGEEYISYYDLWDLDPPFLKKMGIDLDALNFPIEIYGRIYKSDFDKVFS